jgi:hypothetical protein
MKISLFFALLLTGMGSSFACTYKEIKAECEKTARSFTQDLELGKYVKGSTEIMVGEEMCLYSSKFRSNEDSTKIITWMNVEYYQVIAGKCYGGRGAGGETTKIKD